MFIIKVSTLLLSGLSVVGAHTVQYRRAETGLNAQMKTTGRYFGTFADTKYLDDEPYAKILGNLQEHGSITPGNSMKWESTEKSRGSFTFETADSIVKFAEEHGQKIRGHTLVWYSQLPQWVKNIQTKDTILEVMNNHITKQMAHWKGGNVWQWDVVNEPFDDSGNYRESVFYNLLGKDFIATAFKTARKVDPAAKLYLNEYNNESGAKGDAFYNLAKELVESGVPIDGVGIQGHYILGKIPTSLQKSMQALADLGLDVAITELDIRIENPTTESKLQQQADDFEYVTKACLAISKCVGITSSAFTDKYSWVPTTFEGFDNANPWNKSLEKKPAYYGISKAISSV
ncbi:hypothetical protein V496_10043 [Pseudogymnoascus sp. VKM F-4515 (FW-2607)]|nr:hypothetical protein V496_10043 [Pseudogymnoascus sp. VKM F-4515 (FW-2607)]KFY76948.1 hypothetical protein V498_09473 [Pseudogymnoascus sp. VKM F-4517 (FW-2822)]